MLVLCMKDDAEISTVYLVSDEDGDICSWIQSGIFSRLASLLLFVFCSAGAFMSGGSSVCGGLG